MKLKIFALAALLAFTPVPVIAQQQPVAVVAAPSGDTPAVIASTPEAITAAKEDTSVTIEWGNFVNYAADTVFSVLSVILLGVATYAAKKLPGIAGMIARQYVAANGEELVANVRNWAINSVQGATHDKALEVNVGSSVIASSIERVVNLQNADDSLKALVDKLGGPKGIAEKVFRTLHLDEMATKENVLDAGIAKARFPLSRG